MSKNKTKKAESETPEVKAVAPQAKEKGWEPAICSDGVKIMLEKGTRVVSQTEEIARLNKELDETRKQNVELEERVAKLTAENKYVVTECDKLIERAKGSAEAANKDAARWLAELQETRQTFRFWRLAAIAIAGYAILNAVWPLLGF